jgi:hypothetical protein
VYIYTINTKVSGIPAKIGVTRVYRQAGSCLQNEVSDLDYHGYSEYDYEILDTRGHRAMWLERKLTDAMRIQIEQEIAEAV